MKKDRDEVFRILLKKFSGIRLEEALSVSREFEALIEAARGEGPAKEQPKPTPAPLGRGLLERVEELEKHEKAGKGYNEERVDNLESLDQQTQRHLDRLNCRLQKQERTLVLTAENLSAQIARIEDRLNELELGVGKTNPVRLNVRVERLEGRLGSLPTEVNLEFKRLLGKIADLEKGLSTEAYERCQNDYETALNLKRLASVVAFAPGTETTAAITLARSFVASVEKTLAALEEAGPKMEEET